MFLWYDQMFDDGWDVGIGKVFKLELSSSKGLNGTWV